MKKIAKAFFPLVAILVAAKALHRYQVRLAPVLPTFSEKQTLRDAPKSSGNAGPIFINQGTDNRNCGFASAAMALGALSLPIPPPPKNVRILSDGQGTLETLTLRYLGTGQLYSDIPGYSFQLIQAVDATKVARAVLVPHANKWDAVAIMKNDFGNTRTRKAYLAGGMTNRGWALPIRGSWKHTVAVIAYDSSKDRFFVFDPLAAGPMDVSSSQLHAFMAAATPAVSLDLNLLLIRVTPR